MSRERQIQQLNRLVLEGQAIERLKASEEWVVVAETLENDIEQNLKEMLDSNTTSQRYYELRAEINATKKLLDTLDVKLARSDTAAQQKAKLEEA